MKLPGYRRINKQDYEQEYQDLIERLAFAVNQMDVIFQSLSKNISIKDNLFCTMRDITLNVDSTGKPKVLTSFNIDTMGQLQGTNVIFTENKTNPSIYPTSAVQISYTQTNSTIIINHVTGLPANYDFLIRVVAWG